MNAEAEERALKSIVKSLSRIVEIMEVREEERTLIRKAKQGADYLDSQLGKKNNRKAVAP